MAATYYPTEDLNLNIARGLVKGTSHINKFGYNASVGTSYESITDLGGDHSYADANNVVITSSSTEDDEDKGGGVEGTGAHKVEIQGLDGDYNLITETLITNGTSTRTSTGTFSRIFRMKVTEAGTGDVNAGNITASIGGTDIARIATGQGQTLMAVYTVPTGYTAYIKRFQGSLSKNQEANFQLRTRSVESTGSWNVKGLWGTFSAAVDYEYIIPIAIPEKTDIEIRGKAGATSEMGAIFDIILIKDGLG